MEAVLMTRRFNIFASEADQAPVEPTATNQVVKTTPQPTVKVVAGDFAYTQDEVSSNEV